MLQRCVLDRCCEIDVQGYRDAGAACGKLEKADA